MKFSTRFFIRPPAVAIADSTLFGMVGRLHRVYSKVDVNRGYLWLWLTLYGLIFSLTACSVGDEAVAVSARTIVVSTAVPVETPPLLSTPTPSLLLAAQAAVEAALAASNAQSHARITGTLSRDLKLFEFTAEYARPGRFHYQMEDVEFVMVDALFYIERGDQWLRLPEEESAGFKKVVDGLLNVTPTIVQAQLLGAAEFNGAATQVYEYIGRIQTSQIDRLQQVKVWVRTADNLIVKHEASYEADGTQVFEIQLIDYDQRLVLTALNKVIDLPTAEGRREGAWHEFSSDKGKFTIFLPGAPQESIEVIETALGTIDFHLFTFQSVPSTYMVAYGDYPLDSANAGGAGDLLQRAQASAVVNVKGILVAEEAFTHESESGQSYPGRAIRIAMQEGQGLVRMRMILVGNRLYQVTAAGTPEIITNSITSQFLDSFRLLEE